MPAAPHSALIAYRRAHVLALGMFVPMLYSPLPLSLFRHMHGIHTGVRWSSDLGVGLSLESLDAGVISVGDATPVPTTAVNGDPLYNGGVNGGLTPDSSGGVHFSLFNK